MAPIYPDGPDRAVGHLHGILSTISSQIDVTGGPGLSFRSQGYCRRGGGRAILTRLATTRPLGAEFSGFSAHAIPFAIEPGFSVSLNEHVDPGKGGRTAVALWHAPADNMARG